MGTLIVSVFVVPGVLTVQRLRWVLKHEAVEAEEEAAAEGDESDGEAEAEAASFRADALSLQSLRSLMLF